MSRAVASAGHVIGPPASKGNSPFTAQTFFSARETRDPQKHRRVSMMECPLSCELFHIVERVNTFADLSISNPVKALRLM